MRTLLLIAMVHAGGLGMFAAYKAAADEAVLLPVGEDEADTALITDEEVPSGDAIDAERLHRSEKAARSDRAEVLGVDVDRAAAAAGVLGHLQSAYRSSRLDCKQHPILNRAKHDPAVLHAVGADTLGARGDRVPPPAPLIAALDIVAVCESDASRGRFERPAQRFEAPRSAEGASIDQIEEPAERRSPFLIGALTIDDEQRTSAGDQRGSIWERLAGAADSGQRAHGCDRGSRARCSQWVWITFGTSDALSGHQKRFRKRCALRSRSIRSEFIPTLRGTTRDVFDPHATAIGSRARFTRRASISQTSPIIRSAGAL